MAGLRHPIKLGDAHDVVVEISLNQQGLEWLADELPQDDGFTKDLREVLQSVDDALEAQREEDFG